MQKKLKTKFDNTSFIILVKNNPFYSRKLINHINNQNIKAEFIIADGSKKNQKKIFDKLKKKKTFLYFGEDKNLFILFKKILLSINKSKKKFIFFCDQDDLVNFKTIKLKEKFLLKNKEYSCAKGVLYDFKYLNDKVIIQKKTYKDVCDLKFFFLRHFFNVNFRSYYCLHRKKFLKKSFELIIKYNLKDFRSAEFVMDFINISSGRIKFFNEISVLRWSGIKNKNEDHPINKSHKNRYIWYKYFFTSQKKLVKKLTSKLNIFYRSFIFFKTYIFLVDILRNFIIKSASENFTRILVIYKKTFKFQ